MSQSSNDKQPQRPPQRRTSRTENGKSAAIVDTQISKFFPKSTATGGAAMEKLPRKRSAEQPSTTTTNQSSPVPSTSSSSLKSKDRAKRPLLENLQKHAASIKSSSSSSTSKPKETLISKFFEVNDDDDDDDDEFADFMSPKKKAKPAVVLPKPTRKPRKTTAKAKAPTKNALREAFFTRPEPIADDEASQIAIAISRSLAPEHQHVGSAAGSKVATGKKPTMTAAAFRQTFKEYNPATDADTNVRKRQRKRGGFGNNTALTRRQDSLQTQKRLARLAHICDRFTLHSTGEAPANAPTAVYQMSSEYLARFYIPQRDLFDVNGTANRLPPSAFYTNNLCEVSRVQADYLLRDWSEIPGRDASPKRQRRESSEPMPLSLSPEPEEDAAETMTAREKIAAMLSGVVEGLSDSEPVLEAADADNVVAGNSTQKFDDPALDPFDESDSDDVVFSKHTRKTGLSASQRCASPDMFACSDVGETDDEDSAKIAVPDVPCSLDPALISTSGTLPSPTSEEDRLIDMYNKEAVAKQCIETNDLHVMHSESETPSTGGDSSYRSANDDPEIVKSSDDVALMMSLCCPGASDGVKDMPMGWGYDQTAGIKEEDSESFLMTSSLANAASAVAAAPDEDVVIPDDSPLQSADGSDNTMKTEQFDTCDEEAKISTENHSIPRDRVEHRNNNELVEKDTSTDEVNFSFDSVASDLEESIKLLTNGTVKSGLHRKLLEQTITSNRRNDSLKIIESIEISDDELSDTNELAAKPEVENASLNALVKCFDQTIEISESESETCAEDVQQRNAMNMSSKVLENTSLNALVACFDCTTNNSIDKSYVCADKSDNDTDFSFPSNEDRLEEIMSMQKVQPTVHRRDILPLPQADDSIEISDDEINYSMSHRNSDSPIPRSQCDAATRTNQSLHSIFEEDDAGIVPLPDDVDDLLDQSVQQIVRAEFIANSNRFQRPSSSAGSAASRKFRRHRSDVFGTSMVMTQPPSVKYNEEPVVPVSIEIVDDDDTDDEFDRMVNPQKTSPPVPAKPKTVSPRKSLKPSTSLSQPTTALSELKDLQFSLSHNGHTYDVKVGARCVSPKPNFESMDSPTRAVQLKRYGLKALPRRKAIICLEHIYNRTHPFVDCRDLDSDAELKRANFDAPLFEEQQQKPIEPPAKATQSIKPPATAARIDENHDTAPLQLFSGPNHTTASLPYDFFVYFLNVQSEYYLPSPPRGKRMAWCLQPLHIAWYNLLADNPRLYEEVLQYRPIELRLVRTHFKELGMLFDANDMIAFFDKHCITFRTESGARTKPKTRQQNVT